MERRYGYRSQHVRKGVKRWCPHLYNRPSMELCVSPIHTLLNPFILTLQIFRNGDWDLEEIKIQPWLQAEPRAKPFEYWQILKYRCGSLFMTQLSRDKGSSREIIMVDPLEAKRLAAVQLQQIQAKEKLKRRRRIEAINGAWAMIGLTAALVIEGRTGKNILDQLAGYWSAFVHLFVK